jgi:hypothetical protein
MHQHRPEDLYVVDDPIASLRKMYAGKSAPTAAYLAARLMHDLILMDALPARVERSDQWWIISADRDWLASSEGTGSTNAFYRIIPFTVAGPNTHRTEVLLTAFADVVVTRGNDGTAWIVGNESQRALPVAIDRLSDRGRIVAFAVDHRGEAL